MLRVHAAMLHSSFENLERKFQGALAPIPAVQPTGQTRLLPVEQGRLYIFIRCLQNPGNIFEELSTGSG